MLTSEGRPYPLNEAESWRVFEVNLEDITILRADSFRRVGKGEGSFEKSYRITFQPTVIIQAGPHRLTFLNINLLWRFVNEVIHPERYSFIDFKGILETFLPIEFFEAIVRDGSHTISLTAQRNSKDEWIITGVKKYSAAPHQGLKGLVENLINSEGIKVECRFVNGDTTLLTWGRQEIEVREFGSHFVVCARYFYSKFIAQPMEAIKITDPLSVTDATRLVGVLKKAVDSLSVAHEIYEILCDRLYIHKEYPPNSGLLPFKDRNLLERERWDDLISDAYSPSVSEEVAKRFHKS